ncbi:MAG: shikimate dehydrogenase family protein, partial [Planctomycetota bacterium]
NCRAAALRSAPVDSEIIINCTSVGMHPATDACCIDRIGPEVAIVFDTIYNPVRTKLLRLAEKTGAATLTGVDMFVAQGAAQFETWTGQSAPRDVMRQVILEHLPG